jgi:sugar phosphate isomerase/epimerase
MQTSRRQFLKQNAMALAAIGLSNNLLFADFKGKEIMGLQLYSVRDDMKKDPLGTLQKLSQMGYKTVEHAGYVDGKFYGYTPLEFKKILEDLNLKMLSGHSVLNKSHWNESTKDFTDQWKKTITDAAVVGQKYVISPWLDESLRKNYNELLGFLELFNKTGALCKQSGMKFGYHNHDFEFNTTINNQKLFDIILQHTDPALVTQQLDIGNMYHARARAADIMKKYPKRFESLHVKDEIKSSSKGEMGDTYESTVLGKGIIPVKQIIDLARKQGTTLFIIEQESYQGKSPVDAVKEDLAMMKKWGF